MNNNTIQTNRRRKQKHEVSRSIHTLRQQTPPTRNLQETHTNRRYYKFQIQPSVRTQTCSTQLLHT
jgi:hypothetical protein